MLTLRHLLAHIDLLDEARVVAGHRGLDRPVQWAQVADIPGMTDWLQDNELLLTTAFALQEPTEQQQALVTTLADKGVTGLIVAVGRYFDRIPEAMRAAGNDLNFPLIEVSWQIPLLEIGKKISQEIITQQGDLLAKSLNIHQRLTRLVVEGASLNAVANALAQVLERSVTIEDPELRLLAYARRGVEDQGRRQSIRHLQTPRSLVSQLEKTGLLADLQRSPRPIRVGTHPSLGMTQQRIVAPISAGGRVLGYVWLIAGTRALTQLDFAAIEHAATVAALIITKENEVRQALDRRYGDLLNYLLTDGVELTTDITAEARDLGLNLEHSYCILVIHSSDMPSDHRQQIELQLRRLLERQGKPILIANRDGNLIILLAETDIAAAQCALAQLHTSFPSLVAGFGAAYPHLSDMYHSYREAKEAASLHAVTGVDTPFYTFDDLGMLHWLYHLSNEFWLENAYTTKIRALSQHDADSDLDLVNTLEVYFDCGANASEAARVLFLHRSTLLYRLEKCESLCDVDLSCPLHRLNLHVALKAWRIHHMPNVSYNV